ncbi:MAG: antitoxin YezG family protein [Planctomycetes bacterium]|nr:antitoxin YezG family protein [Planctomycetota bacterium]
MIPGIEPLYQRIADAINSTIPEEWVSAEFHALFYADGSTYEAEYVRPDGVARSFSPAGDGDRAIRELRKMFRQAGHRLWGQVRFMLRADGSFNAQWGYDGCDANGDLPFDEQTELRRHEERRLRLIAGKPRQAEQNVADGGA